MPNQNVDEYLQQGIYGPKEINPDERRRFLGTLRERVEIALTQRQVMEETIYQEVEQAMKNHPAVQLILNGHIGYSYLSKYVKKADQYKINYTMVTNKDYNSELGLILAHKDAVDKENIYVSKKIEVPEQKEEKKGLFSFFNKLLG